PIPHYQLAGLSPAANFPTTTVILPVRVLIFTLSAATLHPLMFWRSPPSLTEPTQNSHPWNPRGRDNSPSLSVP
ncbi:hypothetical protein, partial [Tychonema sp. LEGE 07203]|uniref:hypothetical protein n=1 Tax=Tychonema sp. LEGE 07203 TaxID=1828671 RepID=UPI001D1566A9